MRLTSGVVLRVPSSRRSMSLVACSAVAAPPRPSLRLLAHRCRAVARRKICCPSWRRAEEGQGDALGRSSPRLAPRGSTRSAPRPSSARRRSPGIRERHPLLHRRRARGLVLDRRTHSCARASAICVRRSRSGGGCCRHRGGGRREQHRSEPVVAPRPQPKTPRATRPSFPWPRIAHPRVPLDPGPPQ